MFKFHNWNIRLMDKVPDEKGGGGTTPSPELTALQTQNAELIKRLEALEKGNSPKPKDDPKPDDDLADKARKEREEKDKKNADTKKLETALKFTLGAKDFLTTNVALLPKNIESIFQAAEKEVYENEIDKANAIKVGIVSEFFALQSNLDLLTDSQKLALEEFKKLTKDNKQDRVQHVFDAVFEPTFEMLKRLKKAEQVSKGLGDPSNTENAYNQRMQKLARKHYLKES